MLPYSGRNSTASYESLPPNDVSPKEKNMSTGSIALIFLFVKCLPLRHRKESEGESEVEIYTDGD